MGNSDIAEYACDACHSRKIGCSRHLSGCTRCSSQDIDCVYSRSGIIRRTRKRRLSNADSYKSPPSGETETASSKAAGLQSQLDVDVDSTREKLKGFEHENQGSLGALSSLLGVYDAFWPEVPALIRVADGVRRSKKGFFLFEQQQMTTWLNEFQRDLQEGYPLLTEAPSHAIDALLRSSPDEIRETAWLVMFYGMTFSNMASAKAASKDVGPMDEQTKTALRANLWLAINDVRVLLHPSDASIQALTLLACDVEEFTTPSLCWMLMSNACRMLQVIGISHRLDPETRNRRQMLFWTLNSLDQSLALTFGRSSTFHRALGREIPLPHLNQLLRQAGDGIRHGPFLFGAHFIRQLYSLSRVMSDIWSAVYEYPGCYGTNHKAKQDLDTWYKHTMEILEAAALAEKPLLKTEHVSAVEGGLNYIRFHYFHLIVLLTRGNSQGTAQCHNVSHKMLRLLDAIVPDFEDPFNGIGVLWQMLYCPFTPFFILFGKVLSEGRRHPEQCHEALEAMEHLPKFLRAMSSRVRQATKLESIAMTFVQHGRSILSRQHVLASQSVNGTSPLAVSSEQPHPRARRSTKPQTRQADITQEILASLDLNDVPGSPLKYFGQPVPQSSPWQPHQAWDGSAIPFPAGLGDDAGFWPDAPAQMPMWEAGLQDGSIDTTFDWFAWDSQINGR